MHKNCNTMHTFSNLSETSVLWELWFWQRSKSQDFNLKIYVLSASICFNYSINFIRKFHEHTNFTEQNMKWVCCSTVQEKCKNHNLCFCFSGLFGNAVNIETKQHLMTRWWKWFRSWHGLINILSWHLLRGLRKNMTNLSHDNPCPSRDSNSASPKYNTECCL
jgi:hypothetical protein